MLVAAAVVPVPPLLVPEVAGASAHRDDDLRAAAFAATDRLLAAGADRLVVVGQAPTTGPLDGEPDWHPYGLPGLRPSRPLPLALGIGAWLLGQRGCPVPVEHLGVAADLPPADCAALGRDLARDGRPALLVCGDGSALQHEAAADKHSPAAAAFDERLDTALRDGDPAALLTFGVEEATAFRCAGRPAWQVLAGAADGARWAAEIGYAGEPYGVHYVVATWLPARDRP